MASKSKFYYTLLGFLTIIIWGTSAIFTRNLSTGLGHIPQPHWSI